MANVIQKKLLKTIDLDALNSGSNNKTIEERNPGSGQINTWYFFEDMEELKEQHGAKYAWLHYDHHNNNLQIWGASSVSKPC